MKISMNAFLFAATAALTSSPAVLVAAEKQQVKGEIYWTFDDGPIDASITVMDIMKERNVKATFFLNGFHLLGEGDENEDRAPEALQRMVEDGHLIANHGINHMLHNCCVESGECGAKVCNEIGIQHATINTYQNVDREYATFQENAELVRRFLYGTNDTMMIPANELLPNDALETISRLPYTSTWRVEGLQTDCACCTSDDVNRWDPAFDCSAADPTQSSLLASQVADKLVQDGHEIYGYHLNWQPEDFLAEDVSVTLGDAELIAERIRNLAKATTCPNSNNLTHIVTECNPEVHHGKVVILTHEYFFENNRRGQGELNIPKFEQLLDILEQDGFVSKTLDQYFDTFYPIAIAASTEGQQEEVEQQQQDLQEEAPASGDFPILASSANFAATSSRLPMILFGVMMAVLGWFW